MALGSQQQAQKNTHRLGERILSAQTAMLVLLMGGESVSPSTGSDSSTNDLRPRGPCEPSVWISKHSRWEC